MYGKLHERKLRESDYLLSCEEARKELDEYIDNESKRVNVDSAKKMAVLQRMPIPIQIWTTKAFAKWSSVPIYSPLNPKNCMPLVREWKISSIPINSSTKRRKIRR